MTIKKLLTLCAQSLQKHNILGLDFAGNEVIDINTLKHNRAKEKALYLVSLVQDTSSLEKQGLDKKRP